VEHHEGVAGDYDGSRSDATGTGLMEEFKMQRVGLIGLGNMGRFYLQRLKGAGYRVTVLDVDRHKMAWAREQGADDADSPKELAERSDIVLLAVPGSKEVAAVMEGEEGILNGLRAGHLVINTSTTHPDTDAHYAYECAKRKAGYVDAPVTWRPQGLIIMVGGEPEHFAQARPILETIGYKVVHVGSVGNGQRLKAVNQLIGACQLAVWCEAAEFAKGLGLDPNLIRTVLELPMPDNVLKDDFSGGGQLALHYKDLGYILSLAHEHAIAIPLTNLVHEIFKATKNYGHPDWTQAGIVTFWRRLNARQESDG
jgi:2-hydroxy-3-oxopropionate reductase